MAAMHILLIEDDLDLGQALLQALQQGGFTVQWLRSAAATPPLPDANEVAAVLLDLTLPDGQGLALLRRWRRAGLSLPVIVFVVAMAVGMLGVDLWQQRASTRVSAATVSADG